MDTGEDDFGPEEPLLSNRCESRHEAAADGPSGPRAEETSLGDETDSTKPQTTQPPLDADAQEGVQQADAVNLVWTRTALILVYCFIFLNFCINSMEQQTSMNLVPYVVSDFSAHSLLPAISITAYVLSGVLKLPIAKLVDTWGRPQGLAVMSGLATLGLVLMAVCSGVKTYAAAQIFHGVGFSGFAYILDIIIADTSSLKDRALAFAFAGSPFLITTFLGPPAAQWFLQYSSWRASFVVFAILTPLMATPIFFILHSNVRKAKKLGILKDSKTTRTWSEGLWHHAVEFDAVGITLAGTGLTFLLLPFSIAGSAGSKWSSPFIICMLILGLVVTVAFVLFERYFAPKPFVPFQLLLSRNVMGSFTLSATLFTAYFCWDGYYTSYLQVVHQLSVSQAGYVANIFTIGACIWNLGVGWLIRRTDRFKWLALVALPVQLLGGGLMIIFRQPRTPIGYVILCQVLISIGGGTLVVTLQMSVMAVAKHGEVASLLALLGLSSAVGSGIGSSVSGAIWTNTVYVELLRLLPDESKDLAKKIYEDLDLQLSYPVGDPVRDAVMLAYAIAQRRMVIAGLFISMIAIPSVLVWRDVRVSQFKQVKGRVL